MAARPRRVTPFRLADGSAAAVEGNEALKQLAFAETFRMLNNRIGIFAALPLSSLDWLPLQNRLDRIGTSAARSAAA